MLKACFELWMALKDVVIANAIPLEIHGNAGAVALTDLLHTLSWESLLGEGQTAETRFCFTVLWKSCSSF